MYGLIAVIVYASVWIVIGPWARHREAPRRRLLRADYTDSPVHAWTIGGGPGGTREHRRNHADHQIRVITSGSPPVPERHLGGRGTGHSA